MFVNQGVLTGHALYLFLLKKQKKDAASVLNARAGGTEFNTSPHFQA